MTLHKQSGNRRPKPLMGAPCAGIRYLTRFRKERPG